MGYSTTPKYRAEYRTQTGWSQIIWNVTGRTNVTKHGTPNTKNAEAMRNTLNKSFDAGGVNFHVSQAAGVVLFVSEVRVVRQSDGEIMAVTKAPMFEVI